MFLKRFIHFAVAIALMAISITGFAQNKVVVIPLAGDDVPIAPTSKTIFVTSQAYNGNLGGISGADDICQATADNEQILGIYKAWISTNFSRDIPDRRSFIKHNLPYQNVDGTTVANNFADFLDGVFVGIIKSESGDQSSAYVWTGTENNGTENNGTVTELNHCGNWLSDNFFGVGAFGLPDGGVVSGKGWSSHGIFPCSLQLSLYCFEQ